MLLLVVTGHPATGKSTVAETLGDELGLPVFHKDDFKERLSDVFGWTDRASSQRLGHAASVLLYDVADRMLSVGASVILESNFPAEHSSGPLRASAERHRADVLQVVLRAPQSVMERRFEARDRDPVQVLRELEPMPPYVPLDLPGARLELDTTELPVDLGPVLAAARARVGGGSVNRG